MSRFFVDKSNIHDKYISITGDDVTHISRVLRLKQGDSLILCDGEARDYHVSISEIGKDSIRAEIKSCEKSATDPDISLTLYQGLPKGDKMELVIQKCVELGITRIVPVLTDRSVVKIDNARDAENKRARWQKIAAEAAKQCNRGIIPSIALPINFKEAISEGREAELSIMPYELEDTVTLSSCLKDSSAKSLSFFIGPEGGFAEKEIALAVQAGIRTVTLGPRILRTETAGMAVTAIIMHVLGDLGR